MLIGSDNKIHISMIEHIYVSTIISWVVDAEKNT